MAGARSENTLNSEGTGRSLINKTSPHGAAERDLINKTAGSRHENTLISGVKGQRLVNKTSPRAPLISVFSFRNPAKRKVDY
jgi:hypothetical protein